MEINSISNIAEAQAALVALEAERAEMAGRINGADDYNYYSSKISDIDDIIKSVKGLKDEYSNIEAAADDFYMNLGKSFESVSSGAEKASDDAGETVDRQIVQNFNAPLQHIERVEDGADANAAVNALEREIMRKMAGML